MKDQRLPDDFRHLCGSFHERCELNYQEIVRNDDARRAIERWPMFRHMKRHRLNGAAAAPESIPAEED